MPTLREQIIGVLNDHGVYGEACDEVLEAITRCQDEYFNDLGVDVIAQMQSIPLMNGNSCLEVASASFAIGFMYCLKANFQSVVPVE